MPPSPSSFLFSSGLSTTTASVNKIVPATEAAFSSAVRVTLAGSIIRRFAKERMGKKQLRGRLSKAEISAYWLDKYGVDADVA